MSYSFQALVQERRSSNFLNLRTISKINQFDIVYQPLIEDFKNKVRYTKSGELVINMDFLNKERARTLFGLFKFLQTEQRLGAVLKITWEVPLSNILMLETAMDFAELYELQVTISID
ncbi:SiaC family regulatory phosphoprotein [Marinoscillum pacificum]|uniref:SiaC family regulatory phosphoprotein n=1 Tax=Marinoscillum pacificum TaxID=392723 RepID=UPI0021584A4C|nr:SiaC family regulatory phosphoprotein [Marinoscillum pacificum]